MSHLLEELGLVAHDNGRLLVERIVVVGLLWIASKGTAVKGGLWQTGGNADLSAVSH